MAFKFKTRRPALPELTPYQEAQAKGDDVDISQVRIQGQIPMSKEEYWVSVWLDRRRLGYKYQYTIFAGADHFYKLDFLVYTVPLFTMVEPLGNHWHTDRLGQDDRLRQLRIESAMKDRARIPIRFINVEDMLNRDTVEAALERIFHAT